MDVQELKFKGNDPGAVQYGNFINYYKFHSPDERIKLLPKNIWSDPSYCLDIGCNSGDMTIAFSTFLDECCSTNQILGIDIDPILIERAKETSPSEKIDFQCVNIMKYCDLEYIHKYLKENALEKFNVVTCFSITMWIHLNNGDSGLRMFLKTVSELGELIVIEPQPWKCYKTAVKRMRKVNNEFPHFNTLNYRASIEKDIENILISECSRKKILETENNNWGRKLLFFEYCSYPLIQCIYCKCEVLRYAHTKLNHKIREYMEGASDANTNSKDNIHSSKEGSTFNPLHSMGHPSGIIFKSIGLAFMCLLGFGSYFCYDNPASLQDYIEKKLNVSVSKYTLLYSVYAWPNLILCFVGGFLIDRVFGIRLGSGIYIGLTVLGQLCFSTGVYAKSFRLMLFGRFILGIGAESCSVAQSKYAVLWFKGQVLNMVFGLQISFARIGSSLNFMFMEGLYKLVEEKIGAVDALAITFYLASLSCLLSFICSLFLGLMDKKAEKILRVNTAIPYVAVGLSDIRYFNGKFWLITAITVLFYASIYPFFTIGKNFFIEKFKMPKSEANNICSIVYLISAIASPGFGFLIDRTGKSISWIIMGLIFAIFAHAALSFSNWFNPHYGMISLGISYSILTSSLWSLVSLVIPEHQLGTAYGVCFSLLNTGLGISTSIVGVIVDNFGYTFSELFFISSLSVALLTSLILLIWDSRQKDVLNMTTRERKLRQQRILRVDILESEKLDLQYDQHCSNEFGQLSDFYIQNRPVSN